MIRMLKAWLNILQRYLSLRKFIKTNYKKRHNNLFMRIIQIHNTKYWVLMMIMILTRPILKPPQQSLNNLKSQVRASHQENQKNLGDNYSVILFDISIFVFDNSCC